MRILLFLALALWGEQLRASQSFLAIDGSLHTGAADNSHIKQYAYGGLFQGETEGPIRYTLGLAVRHASLDISISGSKYSVTSLDLQTRAGVLLETFHRNSWSPVLAASGLGGMNLITSSSPPAGASESQAVYGWGYEFEAGLRIRVGYRSVVRFMGAYRKYAYTYGGESIDASAFAGRMGITF